MHIIKKIDTWNNIIISLAPTFLKYFLVWINNNKSHPFFFYMYIKITAFCSTLELELLQQ